MAPQGTTYDGQPERPQGGQLGFYVVSDLESHSPEISRYSGLQEALEAYRSTTAEHPQQMAALGGELNGGSLDFVQRRDGKDVLLNDVSKLETWTAHPGVQQAIKEISKQLRLEPSLDQLKQQAKERAAEKNQARKIGSLYRPRGRGEHER